MRSWMETSAVIILKNAKQLLYHRKTHQLEYIFVAYMLILISDILDGHISCDIRKLPSNFDIVEMHLN